MPNLVFGTHADGLTGGFGGAAYGATKRYWVCGTHAGGPTGGFGGTLYGATKRCTGSVKMPQLRVGGHMRAVPLGASVEFPMEPRSAVLDG
eukprot:1540099-Pyramimonas_sp.AAC.1